jgi:hypothetical protein
LQESHPLAWLDFMRGKCRYAAVRTGLLGR